MANPKIRDGLYRTADDVYHYAFKQCGIPYRGSTRCTSHLGAKEWLRMFRLRLAQAEMGLGPGRVPPTLFEAMAAHTTAMTGTVTKKYLNQKGWRLTAHLGPEMNLRIDALDLERIEAVRQRYLSGTWKSGGCGQEREGRTVGGWNSLLRDIKSVLGWAVRRGMIASMPFAMRPGKVQTAVKSVIWPEQVPAFLAEVDKWATQDAKSIVRFMLNTGCRENEALNARWEWLSDRNATYTVGHAKGFEARVIPLTREFLGYLHAHHPRPIGGGLIWSHDKKEKNGKLLRNVPHAEKFSRGVIERASKAIGVVGMHPHRLRATFASTLYEMGTPLSQIRQLLGHKNEATTLGYIVMRPRDLGDTIERYGRLLRGLPSPGAPGVNHPSKNTP